MPAVVLHDRALVNVTGPDAEHFLQNILTIDLETVAPTDLRPGALLTPQGKILFDFLISRQEEGFRLDCRAEIAADFARRLMMYRLRAKAEISVDEQPSILVSWDNPASDTSLEDRRFVDQSVHRTYDSELAGDADLSDWTALRIAHGVAESGPDYALSDAFPHDVLLDQNGGVGFHKGCYVGQEVVSRMKHRGTARRRVLIVNASAPLASAATELTVNGKSVGTLGSTADSSGLAIVRIDKVKDALDKDTPILAGESAVTLTIPTWAQFTFPEATSTEG